MYNLCFFSKMLSIYEENQLNTGQAIEIVSNGPTCVNSTHMLFQQGTDDYYDDTYNDNDHKKSNNANYDDGTKTTFPQRPLSAA